jgi:hypothetical protein
MSLQKSFFEQFIFNDFGLNNIFGFLRMVDIMRFLTICNKNQLEFIPTKLLLVEILKKALQTQLLENRLGFDDLHDTIYENWIIRFLSWPDELLIDMVAMTSDDNTMSIIKFKIVYDFIRNSLKIELHLTDLITFNDGICTILNDSFHPFIKLLLSCKKCTYNECVKCWLCSSDNESEDSSSNHCNHENCNTLVLWHCPVCKCYPHYCIDDSWTCELCERAVCRHCFIKSSESSDFLCTECGEISVLRIWEFVE